MHMPNPKAKSLPFFTNDLDESPTDSASESELLKPFTNATYRALQVRQGLTKRIPPEGVCSRLDFLSQLAYC